MITGVPIIPIPFVPEAIPIVLYQCDDLERNRMSSILRGTGCQSIIPLSSMQEAALMAVTNSVCIADVQLESDLTVLDHWIVDAVPVIAIIDSNPGIESNALYERGCWAVLRKPVSAGALSAVVRRICIQLHRLIVLGSLEQQVTILNISMRRYRNALIIMAAALVINLIGAGPEAITNIGKFVGALIK